MSATKTYRGRVPRSVEMATAAFFAERKARAKRKTLRRLLKRKGGEPPRPGDELP